MVKLNEKQKLLVIAGATVVLCGIAGGGVYYAKGCVDETQTTIDGLEQQVDAAEQKIAKIPTLERDVIILRENVQEYVKILPEEKEVNNFVRATNQFSGQSGVAITRFTPVEIGASEKGSSFARYTYQLEFRATVWQFMKFISFFENYERFVKVSSFNLQSGDSAQGRGPVTEEGDLQHTVTMTVETYVYGSSQSGKDVVIPNYANKVTNLRADILEQRSAIVTGGYEFKGPRGRRDIFVDPRESSAGGPTGGVPEDLQRNTIEECRRDLNEIISLHRRIQDAATTIIQRYKFERTLRERLAALNERIEDVQTKGRVSHLALKVRWTKEVVEPFVSLREEIANAGAGKADRYLSEKDMRDLIAAMTDDLNNGDLDSARDRYDSVQDRIKVPREDPRYALAFDIEKLIVRARLAMEFSSMKLDIGGVCVNEDGKSGVLLNGTVYQEGEYVDNNLLIKAVAAEHVEFVFRGFTVVKTW